MPAGSLQQWLLTLTDILPASNPPFPITGATWEYVARSTPTDTGTPLIKITTSASAAGLLTVISTASVSSVLLQIYPAATVSLAPGTYYHAMWMDPGTPSALSVFDDLLLIDGAPQP
jgi:hypothetical protein